MTMAIGDEYERDARLRVFVANLLRLGFRFQVDAAGRLVTTGAEVTPVLAAEIDRRETAIIARFLAMPAELSAYTGRLLRADELKEAIKAAATIEFTAYRPHPCDGGWLIAKELYSAPANVEKSRANHRPRR